MKRVNVSLNNINDYFHTGLAEIIEKIKEHACSELARQIERQQGQIIIELCSSKHSGNKPFKRAGVYTKNRNWP